MKHITISMDIHKVFGMKGGVGAMSYSQNSSLQKRAADKVKHLAVEAMQELLAEKRGVIKSLGIADLGCSSGPNALSNIKTLLDVNVEAPPHEYRVYLNDLPTNDFNTVFQALPDLYRELNNTCVYIAAYPGSFYGRLFPQDSLHLVYSSNSLHWLSRVPPGIYDEEGSSVNKKSIYISERSPPQVKEAYFKQFQEDMSLFLKSRSAEVVSGGRMVLILLGRSGPQHVDRGNSFFWEILYQSLASLVAEGEVEEDKLESYEVHFYAPSPEELEEQVRKEGSFKVEVVEMFEMDKDSGTYSSYGVAVANTVRSIQESMIAHHFGESILDKLFHLYGRLIDQELSKHDINSITTALILTKL